MNLNDYNFKLIGLQILVTPWMIAFDPRLIISTYVCVKEEVLWD